MTELVFLDTEATGVETEDRLCQVAFRVGKEDCNEFFQPPVPMKIAAMAVHHITPKMLDGKPTFEGSATKARLLELAASDAILVAHNAPYDLGMLAKEGIEFKRSICTLKIAKHIDQGDKFENHQLQYLRYFYGIEIDAGAAHDAFADILVLEQVFAKLLEEFKRAQYEPGKEVAIDTVYEQMVQYSRLPSLIRRFTFGKHNGKLLSDVRKEDPLYLSWLLNQKRQEPEGQGDWIYTLEHYLAKT